MNGGGVFGALIFVIGILVAFSVLFGLFLIVPFFIFLAGIVAMLVADRKRGDDRPSKTETEEDETETRPTTVTREAGS